MNVFVYIWDEVTCSYETFRLSFQGINFNNSFVGSPRSRTKGEVLAEGTPTHPTGHTQVNV